MESSDNDELCLSAETAAALQEFLLEKAEKQKQTDDVEENWQFSQFWYTDNTADILSNECIRALPEGGSIACLSCPTIFDRLLQKEAIKTQLIKAKLFEFDRRFEGKYPDYFEFYDFWKPKDIRPELRNTFDFIVADPPSLNEDTLVRYVQAIRLLNRSQETVKILICTGAILADLVKRLLGCHECKFQPEHRSKLGNEFRCYVNYDAKGLQ
ncbi:hypothetical protein AB6A40_009795 [Gnathostoma spinigerum]|uniref:Protein-lysine N-methyltransferase AB6A40_009795 n=1 Tax=Gnathostoma spinigerum TaxID=75299 RepID=A0ABD6EUS1_9BILA